MDIKEYVKFICKPVQFESIVWAEQIKRLCRISYIDHPEGCPNCGDPKCRDAPFMRETVRKYPYLYLGLAVVDFKKYLDMMRRKHTDWSEKQIKCVMWYQKQVKSHFYQYMKQRAHGKYLLLGCGSGFGDGLYSMEACGIYVWGLFENLKLPYERNAVTIIHFASLLCLESPVKLQQKLM